MLQHSTRGCPKPKASKDYLNLEWCFFCELKWHTYRDSLFGNYELMFKVTNEDPRGMYLKSWSVLGINTKDKTIERP